MENRNRNEFDLNGALDRLAARVCRDIKSKRRRERAISEFRAHLEDAAEEIMRQGNTPEAAYAELEESLGDTDKLSTLMASVHNTHHFPFGILIGVAVAGYIAGLLYLYFTVNEEIARNGLQFQLQMLAIIAIVALVLFVAKWTRAIAKRASALRRLKKYVKENGGTITRHNGCYKSLFTRVSVPELTVDMGDRRYILAMWATASRLRTLHLQDNGIYSYNKHFGYMLVSPGIAPHSRLPMFHPKGMENDPLFSFYHSEMMTLPKGVHLMPEVRYGDCFSPDKINIPIFLLNPIPMNVEICENAHIHKVAEGDTLPASMGGARLYSMSGFISLMEEIRIFGKEGGQGRRFD
ncbi:MAG: hypothetical protein IJD38_01305 [Clostridia bacterium]|nr:hypothetical protein [Clostridia bacterium]